MKLRNLESKDASLMFDWMVDPDMFVNFQYDPSKITIKSCEEFILNSQNDVKNKHYAIVDDNDMYMGTISIKNIDSINLHGEYAVSVRKEYHGTSIAYEATCKLLDIAFNNLRLNKIYLNVLSNNLRAIKFYEKIGFIYEGLFKEHIKINDDFKDLKWFSILRKNWRVCNGIV